MPCRVRPPPLGGGGADAYVRGLSGVILADGGEPDPALYGAAPEDGADAPSRTATASSPHRPAPPSEAARP